MLELKTLVPKAERPLLAAPQARRAPHQYEQRRMMIIALALLLIALATVLYRDRDFWLEDTPEAADQPGDTSVASNPPIGKSVPQKKHEHSKSRATDSATAASAPDSASIASPAIERTVLPPLEIEVVAGNVHRIVRPGSSSVHVDIPPDSPSEDVSTAAPAAGDTMTGSGGEATEQVHMSADTSEVVTHAVNPDYPVLARQMKVQGSVILQAMIGRNGSIQELQVLSGPPILASAAQEAVKQWHFRPHYQGSESVETKAKITVNFTISTN